MAYLETRDLYKEIIDGENTNKILSNINFVVREQEYVAVMGKSGSGKSTLLGILAGIDRVSRGVVLLDGTDITGLTDNQMADFRNSNIGIVFQSFNLIPNFTALENIEVPVYFSKKKIDARKQALKLIEAVGLADKTGLFPHQLSGGEQQRIAIARALVTNPRLLLADEPTGALDSGNGKMVMGLLQEFRTNYSMTIVLVTHDKIIAQEADRIVYLRDGMINEGAP